jgi:hypothetical protein
VRKGGPGRRQWWREAFRGRGGGGLANQHSDGGGEEVVAVAEARVEVLGPAAQDGVVHHVLRIPYIYMYIYIYIYIYISLHTYCTAGYSTYIPNCGIHYIHIQYCGIQCIYTVLRIQYIYTKLRYTL